MSRYPDTNASYQRDILVKKQNHKSPLTGLPLHGRLEKDHIVPKRNGGSDDLENMQLLPRPEHIFKHFDASQDERLPKSERLIEIQTVADRLMELGDSEIDELNQLIRTRTKSKVHFV